MFQCQDLHSVNFCKIIPTILIKNDEFIQLYVIDIESFIIKSYQNLATSHH